MCRACGSHCSYGEMLLLVAIHLRERQLGQIEELMSSAIQMKVSVSGHNQFHNKNMQFHEDFMYQNGILMFVSKGIEPSNCSNVPAFLTYRIQKD